MAGIRPRLLWFVLCAGLAGFGLLEMARQDDPRERSPLGAWLFLAGVFGLALFLVSAALNLLWGPSQGRGDPGPPDQEGTAGWFLGEPPERRQGHGTPKGQGKARSTVAQAIRLLEQALALEPLTPPRVWEVFQQWVGQPVACEAEEWSASVGYAGGAARVEFRRTFRGRASRGDRSVALVLFSERPDAPRLPDAGTACDDREDLAAFFERVEELPGFTPALAYPHWTFGVERA